MKKILFPTDFSDSAMNALEYAAKFASEHNAELVLYHSYGLFQQSPLEKVDEKLKIMAAETSAFYDIISQAVIEPTANEPGTMISREANAYDLVIMGTNGVEDLTKFFRGSNAYNTIIKSNIPLLIIPLDYKGTALLSVVYAYDYYNTKKLPVKQLLPWLKAINKKEITVLQVLPETDNGTIKNDLQNIQIELQRHVDVKLAFDAIYSSTPSISINQYMTQTNSSILCLCSERRNFIEELFHKSVIKPITAIAGYPLFIIHQ